MLLLRMGRSGMELFIHPFPTFMCSPALPTATAILPRISMVHASPRATGGILHSAGTGITHRKAECTFLWSFHPHYMLPMKASGGELASHFHSSSGCGRLAASFRACVPEGRASFGRRRFYRIALPILFF